ncbi:unnamed protein product, partial [Rotaria sordida]
MKQSLVELNDLPDEILIMILRNLPTYEAIYTFIGLNKRFNRLVHDSTFTNRLTLMTYKWEHFIGALPDRMLDQFCIQILPKVHHKIQWLELESSSMNRVLLATDYPNLYGLSLYNLNTKQAKQLFSGRKLLNHNIKNQISSLVIDTDEDNTHLTKDISKQICTYIFTTFINLKYLNLFPSVSRCPSLSFNISSPTVFSSNLLELYINLINFTDCFHILDGRFNQLRTLHVKVPIIWYSDLVIKNNENLTNLKCFSLYCSSIYSYNGLIVPLLCRMSNLEKLGLYFCKAREVRFIDGNSLKKITKHMSQLNKFMFNIRSLIYFNEKMNLLSNEDIQYTFRDFKINDIICCVDYFFKEFEGQCLIYSNPYTWKDYNNITNNFPGGLFQNVRRISLFDEHPFEHEFFLKIAQSFPFLNQFDLTNHQQQKNKRRRIPKNFLTVKFPHLTQLSLNKVHDDYVQQFLIDTKTCLPNKVVLRMDYEQLKKVTYNFRRDTTRTNCSKIQYFLRDN